MSALEFIDRLVSLIPDKNLKLIRYYGLYSRRTSAKLQKMLTPLSREKPNVVRRKEVVVCSKCGQIMDLVGVTRPVEIRTHQVTMSGMMILTGRCLVYLRRRRLSCKF